MASTITKKQDGHGSHVMNCTVTQDDSKILVRISYDRMKADQI
jgi:hypothetical protein